MMGIESLRMMGQLFQLSRRHQEYFFHCSTVIAGLTSLLVGSIFEAYLLANLGFNVLMLLVYWALGQYLLQMKFGMGEIALAYNPVGTVVANPQFARSAHVPIPLLPRHNRLDLPIR